MGTIIPRWEWRTFGDQFGAAEEIIKASGEPFSRESAEVYVISRNSHDNTKIRDELMDIKTLQATDDNKLEQWMPVMKSGFPLPIAELEKVCASWKVATPEAGAAPSYDAFISDIVGANPALEAVDVHKTRHGYTVDGATVELADLVIAGEAVRTVCVEHTDPALVWEVVGKLGLQASENVNYLRAIKRIVGWEG